MSAREHLFWASGGILLMVALLGLAIGGRFFGMPARGLFVFIACVVLLPMTADIHSHWKGWQRQQSRKII